MAFSVRAGLRKLVLHFFQFGQPGSGCLFDLDGGARKLADEGLEIGSSDDQEVTVLGRPDAGRPRQMLHRRYLAEEFSRAQRRQNGFLRTAEALHDLNGSRNDHVECRADPAFPDDHLAGIEAFRASRARYDLDFATFRGSGKAGSRTIRLQRPFDRSQG